MIKLAILTTILFLAAFASQDTPIPPKPEGYSYGSNTPTLHIEAFYDVLDPDSRASWRVLRPLLEKEYNITTNKTLRFTIHIFPQPQHTYSFLFAQGAKIVYDYQKDPMIIWTYLDLFFEMQEAFDQIQGMYEQSLIIDLVVLWIYQDMASPEKDEIRQGLQYGTSYDYETRMSWKYGCSRGVTDSPFYLANGVAIDGAGKFTAAQWRSFINGGYIHY